MATNHIVAPHYVANNTLPVDPPAFPGPCIYQLLLGEAERALYQLHFSAIWTRQREQLMPRRSTYNFRSPPMEGLTASVKHLEAVHLRQAHGYKRNASVGAMMAHKMSGRLRYFHASASPCWPHWHPLASWSFTVICSQLSGNWPGKPLALWICLTGLSTSPSNWPRSPKCWSSSMTCKWPTPILVCSWFMRWAPHYDMSIIHLVQNAFDKDPSHRTISLNATYIVLFMNPRDMSQVSHLDKLVYPGGNGLLTAAYRNAASSRAHSFTWRHSPWQQGTVQQESVTDTPPTVVTGCSSGSEQHRRHHGCSYSQEMALWLCPPHSPGRESLQPP